MRRLVAPGLVLFICSALTGCTESGGTGASTADPSGLETLTTPASDDPVVPNFAFAVGGAYQSAPDTSAEFVELVEQFFAGVLAPLQRLDGLMARTVSIVYERCGTANSFHDPATDTITLCHELSEYVHQLQLDYLGPAALDPQADAEQLTAQVLRTMAFVLYHEIGHALDYQRDLPLVGNVESGIDAIATVIAVETGQFLYPLGAVALFQSQPPSFTGQHGGGLDRSGDILCWTSGGEALSRTYYVDPFLAQTFDFEAANRDCIDEYAGQRDTVRGWLPGLARLNAGTFASGEGREERSSAFVLELGAAWLEQEGAGADPDTRERVRGLLENALAPLDDAIEGLVRVPSTWSTTRAAPHCPPTTHPRAPSCCATSSSLTPTAC